MLRCVRNMVFQVLCVSFTLLAHSPSAWTQGTQCKVVTHDGEHLELTEGVDADGCAVVQTYNRVWLVDSAIPGPQGAEGLSDGRTIEIYNDVGIKSLLLVRTSDGLPETGFMFNLDYGTQTFDRVVVMPSAAGRPELLWVEQSDHGGLDGGWNWWVLTHDGSQLELIAHFGRTGHHNYDTHDAGQGAVHCTRVRRGLPELDAMRGRVRVVTDVDVDHRWAQLQALVWSIEDQAFVLSHEREAIAPDYSESCVDEVYEGYWDEIDFEDDL